MVIAILLCLLYRRRRRARNVLYRERSGLVGPRKDSLGSPDTMMTTLAKSTTRSTVDDLLPLPTSDSELAGCMNDLSTAIKNHAHSYYGGGDALSAGQAGASLPTALKTSSPISAKKLSALLANPLYNVKAIRFLVAWSVLGSSTCSRSLSQTLLPPEIAACMHEMDIHPGDPSQSVLRSTWRQITATLMMHSSESEIGADDNRFKNVHRVLEDLDAVLAPLASKRTNEERRQDLESIIKQAARLTSIIFALPTIWEYAWSNPHGDRASEFVLFPALVQTGDNQGRMLSDPRILTDAQIVNIGNILS